MQLSTLWRTAQAVSLVAGLAIAAIGPSTTDPGASAPVALARDKDEDKNKPDDEELGRVLNGQVLGIYQPGKGWSIAPGVSFDQNTPGDMWALRVANVDGIVPAVLYKPEQIQELGLRLGDYVSLDGEFDHGVFMANNFEITDRCC